MFDLVASSNVLLFRETWQFWSKALLSLVGTCCSLNFEFLMGCTRRDKECWSWVLEVRDVEMYLFNGTFTLSFSSVAVVTMLWWRFGTFTSAFSCITSILVSLSWILSHSFWSDGAGPPRSNDEQFGCNIYYNLLFYSFIVFKFYKLFYLILLIKR